MTELFKVECGACNETFETKHSPEKRDGCTMNCPKCGTLLICHEDGSTQDFHLWLNEESEGLWPADGNGTEAMVIFDGKTKGGVYGG